MGDGINLARLADRSGPGAEAEWREDIRRAAVAGGATEDQAATIAAAAPIEEGGFGGVEYGLYYGWSRSLSDPGTNADLLALHPGLAARWPDFAGMAARWMDTSGMSLVSRAEDRR